MAEASGVRRLRCTAKGANPGVKETHEQDAKGAEDESPDGVSPDVCPVHAQRREDEPGPSGYQVHDRRGSEHTRVGLPRDAFDENEAQSSRQAIRRGS
jgi:hypothetical protein